MKAAIYVRVSTRDQHIANQTVELERLAELRGWQVVATYSDDGISGAKGRDQRPGLDEMLIAAGKRKFDIVLCWSIDRLGRSLQGLIETVNELHALSVDVVFLQQSIDTTTPAGKLCFGVFASLAQYERELLRERIRCGIANARRNGKKLGRPSQMNSSVRSAILALRQNQQTIRQIAATLQVGVGSVYRVITSESQRELPAAA